MVLALLVTRGGIPLDYELYPGNTYEGDTLCRALDGITERYDVSRVTVVADAGLFSRSNLEWLRERNLPYIVGFRAKNATRKLKEQILDADGYEGYRFDQDGEAQYSCKIIARGEERIIATYSKKRGEKRPPQPRAGAGEAAQAPEAKRKAAQPGVERTCAVSQHSI